MIHSEVDYQRLQAEQNLILNQIDNAIALLDSSYRVVLFNKKLVKIWELAPEWLANKPHIDDIFTQLLAKGYWYPENCQELKESILKYQEKTSSFCVKQTNGMYLEISLTPAADYGILLTIKDITIYQSSQASLNAEVKRLRFLLGLNERLQHSDSVREIAQFALNYLVKEMNASFGDVKVITGSGNDRSAGALTSQVSTQFIATYGEPVVEQMQTILSQGIPYGKGLFWEVVETGSPLFIEDYANQTNALDAFRHPGIGKLGIFPIPGIDSKIIGVLTLEARNLEALQATPHQDILSAACRTLGVAIERAISQESLYKINRQLEQASQLKSEFLASMSHELRTPLNSILGFADLLLRQNAGPLTSRQTNYVQLINSSGQHLLQLINDILDLSKIEAGKAELDLQPVSIQSLCNECLKMVQPRADKKRLTLLLQLDYRIDQAMLDERRTRQMVINLLSNAVKFTPEGGEVKLSSRLSYGTNIQSDYRPDISPVNASTPYLCLEVEDSGIGIPEERWHLLFSSFQQVDASLARKHEGTGLGLVLTKRLAELHGGTVSLQSTVGKGSIFRVWLPLTEMRQNIGDKTDELNRVNLVNITVNSSNKSAPRILVIEDQSFNQILITEILELDGYQVEIIGDGQTMWEVIHSPLIKPGALPDLILMDIQLPDIDGLALMKELKSHHLWHSVPIIAVTAMAMSGDRDRCLEAGASAYLSKPLEFETLKTTVKSLLDS